jgi:hypothetical protein
MAEIAEVAADVFVESSTGLLELASEVPSIVQDSGLEFLNTFGGPESFFESGTGLLTLGSDLGALDASYELVGSFAGDAGFFNLTDFGSIIDSATTSVSDFAGSAVNQAQGFFSGLLNEVPIPTETGVDFVGRTALGKLVDQAGSFVPSFDTLAAQAQKSITQQIVTTGIRTATGAINSQVAQIPVVGSFATGVVNRTAGAVSNAVNQQIGGLPITGPSLSQLTGITPNIGIPNVPGIQLASLSNNIPLNLLKTQTGAVSVTGVNGQPLSIQTPGINPTATQAVNPETGDYYTPAANTAPSLTAIDQSAGPVGYTVSADPEGGFAVVSNETGLPVATGLTEQQALLQAQEQTFIDAGEVPQPGPDTIGPLARPPGGFTPEQLNAIAAAQGVDAGELDINAGPQQTEANLFAAEAAITAGLRDQARQQQTIRAQRQNQAQSTDWRVRLRLAPTSDYLYNAPDCGPVLYPLRDSDGVIFPYTPTIDMGYKANYDAYDLTHSNYRGYFYKNSNIDQIQLKATFTAQDTTEANYLLAVIHFFRSVTKMFYGQDAQRGSPPPLTYLSGLGDYQFREHPCLVSQFNYNLPNNVDYIRAQSVLTNGTNLLNARKRQTVLGNPLSYALQRLSTVGMTKGGLDQPFAPSGSLGADNSTYVPTKMDISLILLPIQSRSQVSKQFSLQGFANGNLLKGGFW